MSNSDVGVGIHGLPKSSWNSVRGKSQTRDGSSAYCQHGIATFPTWHRPYLAMLEVGWHYLRLTERNK
jgi:Common central domain of tyrosinase